MGRGLWEGRFVAEGEAGLIESSGRGKSDDIFRGRGSRLSRGLGGGSMVESGRVDGGMS